MGRVRAGASFPVASPLAELPGDYAGLLAELKQRISTERLRVMGTIKLPYNLVHELRNLAQS